MSAQLQEGIIFEQEQSPHFLDEIAKTTEGAAVLSCIQCGTCSGTCCVASILEHSPRQIFAMIRAGMKDQVLQSTTPWMCASCYKCTVDCPAQIKITEIMYLLKRLAIKEGTHLSDSDAKRFFGIFLGFVRKYGRVYELGLMLKYMLFHHPLQLIKQAPVGLQMFKSGTLRLFPHKVQDPQKLKKIINRALACEQEEGK
jgi:heterodisulfide reductase subunit C